LVENRIGPSRVLGQEFEAESVSTGREWQKRGPEVKPFVQVARI